MIHYDKNSNLIEKTIFYLEDDELTNESTSFLLKRFYKNVHSFYNANDALNAINNGITPDFILSDIEMPIINGIEFAKKIRELKLDIPFIFMTAYSDSEYLKEALELKINKYIVKPVSDTEKLINEIFTLLEEYENSKVKDFITDSSIYTKTDDQGIIIYVSNSFCELTGFSRDELIGKRHNILRHPNMPKLTYENLWKTINSGKIWKGELKNIRKNGEAYWIEHTISPEFDNEGNITGYYSLSNDITEKKDFEEEHLRLLQEAKHSSIEELLENISHQWRQPLSVISLNAAQLEIDLDFESLTEEEKRVSLGTIISNTHKLSKTIEKFSKYISNDKKLCAIYIEDEIDLAIDMIGSSLSSNKIDLILDIDFENKTKMTFVQNEIAQIIISLMTNSKEALIQELNLEKKWIKISSSCINNIYTIIIEDNANGIDESIKDRIFEPYFTTKFKSDGVGLGLHLTQRIVKESFKGDIDFENSEFGAKFTISFPIKE